MDSSIGVATLWTPREAFAKKLRSESYKVLGQLYSNDGINPLLRNVLANPTIRTIVLCGQDKIGSADVLTNFIAHGVRENGAIIGKEEARVDKEISRDAIERFRKHVNVLDLRGQLNAQIVQKAIDECHQDVTPWAEPELFPEPQISTDWYPSENAMYTYRGKTVADVWPKILYDVMRFGEEKESHYSPKQKELWNVAAVITDEDPDNIMFASYFPFTRDHFAGYKPQVLSAEPIPSISYTYGMRLRNVDGINQIQSIVEKLRVEPFTRRAVAVLWNVPIDDSSEHPPCLTVVQASIKYNQLYMTTYLRSNDMMRGWPENILAFRCMQKEIADQLQLSMGPLTSISASAHIYEESYAQAKEIIAAAYDTLPCEQDPRGNYIISVVQNKEIRVTHLTPDGRKIDTIVGKNAMEIFNTIAGNHGISVIIHALDLGAELQKAEIALQTGIAYTQDRPLPINDRGKLPFCDSV